MRFSRNVAALEPSATLALTARARRLKAQGLSIIDLSAGEPSFHTPEFASAAASESIRAGRTGYPPTQGIPELREAVTRYLSDTTAASRTGTEEVLISAGVKQALFNCAYCLFQTGDAVLVPTPSWPTYLPLVRLTGADPIEVPTRWEEGFRLDPDQLERRRGANTRGLILNSPGNPTGVVYEAGLLAEIAAWCERHGVWLLSDEIYRRLYYAGDWAPSVFDLQNRAERVVLFDGISKSFSMPGWRIGFAAGPRELIGKATDLQSQTTSGASAPAQYAAAAAFGDVDQREETIQGFRHILARRREAALQALEGVPGLEVRAPEGAIYLFVRLTGGEKSASVAEQLLVQAGVACVPGEPFGSPGFLRFSFAADDREIREGLGRVAAFFRAR
ncbi:MAG: pyridoxal phosphate-dependent aminotransferase [Gemmatimonadota bacterium]